MASDKTPVDWYYMFGKTLLLNRSDKFMISISWALNVEQKHKNRLNNGQKDYSQQNNSTGPTVVDVFESSIYKHKRSATNTSWLEN